MPKKTSPKRRSRTRRAWSWFRRKVRNARVAAREMWEVATVETKTASVHGYGWSTGRGASRPAAVDSPRSVATPSPGNGPSPTDQRVERYRAIFDNVDALDFEVYVQDDTDVLAAAWWVANQHWGIESYGRILTWIEPQNGYARARIGPVGYAPRYA